jgi:hypothetical protein
LRAIRALRQVQTLQAKGNILLNREVREQRWLLEQVGQAAALRRSKNVRRRILQNFTVQGDASGRRLQQAGNAIKKRGLAGS